MDRALAEACTLDQRLAREIRIWSGVDHPNIIKLLGFAVERTGFPMLLAEWQEMEVAIEAEPKFRSKDCGLPLLFAFLLEGIQRRTQKAA